MSSYTSDFSALYNRNIKMVYRLCYIYMKNQFDAEDAAQTCFTNAFVHKPKFNDIEHEKAWLIVIASNVCKSMLRKKHRKEISIDSVPVAITSYDPMASELIRCILSMPEKYKTVIFLHYYEGYSCVEISLMLNKKETTIRSQLHRGREILKEILGGDIS